jgi:hypothetical protein
MEREVVDKTDLANHCQMTRGVVTLGDERYRAS